MKDQSTWILLLVFLDISSSFVVHGSSKSTATLTKEESLELDFHRINNRPTFFNEEILDEKLVRADPFLDDFVPPEFTGYDPLKPELATGYDRYFPRRYTVVHQGSNGSPAREFPRRSTLKRLPRDVDSNMIENVPDIEHGLEHVGQAANYSAEATDDDEEVSDDHSDAHGNATLEVVFEEEYSGVELSGNSTGSGDEDVEADSDGDYHGDVNEEEQEAEESTSETTIITETPVTETVPATENTEQDQSEIDSETQQPTTTLNSTSTATTTETPTTTKKPKRRSKTRRSEAPPLTPSGTKPPTAETIKWIRNQIEILLQHEMSPEDADLLRSLNETLSKPNMDKVFELTVAFMKINERITELHTENEVEEEEEDSPETNVNGERSLACKNLNKFKIMPEDTAEMVRIKYASSMKCYMDETEDPCQDFYKYACGSWVEYHPIPKDKSGYDTFEILREDLHSNLIDMFEEEISEEDTNATAAAKLLYNSCMDTATIEERREAPLLSLLEEFGGWAVLMGDDWIAENFSWVDTITKLRMLNNDILVSIWIGPDGKDSDDFILQFDQSDLLLPSSDYYKLGFNHPIMQTYYNMVVDVATILGADSASAKKEMKDLIDFETDLAGIMISPMLRRNFSEIYKKMPLADLQKQVPLFNFSQYLEPILPRKLNSSEDVVIYALPFYQKLTKLIGETDKRILSNYILWRFIRHRINNLDQRFEVAQHGLYRMLYGREETPPRRKFCVSYVNGNLGNVVGSLFVKRHFDVQSKKDMEALTNEVQTVFRDLVLKSDWLSEATKRLADVKIQNIVHNIGYPDDIIDEEQLLKEVVGLHYDKKTFFENVLNNLRARTQREMSQLDDSVNRTLWTTTPAVVNAYYSRNRNQIMFPAAILQPPFYHKHFPKALNYGGIGIVIGHEITHGFDDKGRQFDFEGNIKQWWDIASFQNFRDRKQCIIDQYGQYKVEEVDIHLNGENTQGENIADNGGIKQAYYAYKNWLSRSNLLEEDPLPGLESLSSEQLFFLNFAQVWCGHTRPEALRSKLKTAVHAPGPYRVLGTVSNSVEFARAFNCPSDSRMNPTDKCSVW